MTDVKDSQGNAPAVETPLNMTKLNIPRQNMTNAQQRTKYDINLCKEKYKKLYTCHETAML